MDDHDETVRLETNNGKPAPDAQTAPARTARRRTRLQNIVLGVVLGSVVGLIGVFGAMVYFNRGQLPLMKAGDFEVAEKKWKDRGPPNYDMDLEGNFDQKGRLHVEVHNGKVTAMTLDGQPKPARLWDYYSVPGLFGIIREDLERNAVAAAKSENLVIQQAEFDPDLGYPRRYQRSGASAGLGGDWKVVRFRAVE
jgi:Family of unknown function (DUF6174)